MSTYRIDRASAPSEIRGLEWREIPPWNRGALYVVASSSDEPVGQVGLFKMPSGWRISQFFIREDHRGRGLSRALLECIYQEAANVTRLVTFAAKKPRPADSMLHRSERYGSIVRIKENDRYVYATRIIDVFRNQILSGVIARIEYPHFVEA